MSFRSVRAGLLLCLAAFLLSGALPVRAREASDGAALPPAGEKPEAVEPVSGDIPAGGRGKVVLDLGDSTREITACSDVALSKGDPVITTALNAEVFTVKPL